MEKKRKEVEARAKKTFQSMASRSLNSLLGSVRHLTEYMSFVKVCRYKES